jgi:hypothetical protein
VTNSIGEARPTGEVGLRVIRAGDPDVPWPCRELAMDEIRYWGMPRRGLSEHVNRWRASNRRNLARGLTKVLPARALKIPHFYGQLFLSHIRADGERIDLGLASMRVVTTAGVVYICADMAAGANDINLFKFHGIGTGAVAEAAADTALGAESTTALNPDNTRATGSQAQGTSGANATYTTVGTLTVDATIAATEHGIFTQAATGGGTLLDRSVFSVVNLASGDSLQATYVLTVNSGG